MLRTIELGDLENPGAYGNMCTADKTSVPHLFCLCAVSVGIDRGIRDWCPCTVVSFGIYVVFRAPLWTVPRRAALRRPMMSREEEEKREHRPESARSPMAGSGSGCATGN